jgi:hypothetical protein
VIVTVKRVFRMSTELQIDTPSSSTDTQDVGNTNGLLNITASRRSGAWRACFAKCYPGALTDDMYPETFPPDSDRLQPLFGGTTVYQGTTQIWELSGAQPADQGRRVVTLVVWPDTGEPAAIVLNVTRLGAFGTTSIPVVTIPAPPPPPPPPPAPAPAPAPALAAAGATGGPEVTVNFDGTIPLQVFPAAGSGVTSCKAIVYPGDVADAHIPRQPPAQGGGTTSFSSGNSFQGTLPVGAVEINRKLAKTLVVWPDQGNFDPLVARFSAVFNPFQFNVPVRAKSALWFAWAPDGTAAAGHPAANHRPAGLAVPIDAKKVSLQANGNWNPGGGACGPNGNGAGNVQLSAANLASFQAAGLQSSNISQIAAPKGALVGLWGAHPTVPTAEFLLGSVQSNLAIPKGPMDGTHPQPSFLFLGLHDADSWTDNGNETISVTVFWDTSPIVAVPIPGPVIINEDGVNP